MKNFLFYLFLLIFIIQNQINASQNKIALGDENIFSELHRNRIFYLISNQNFQNLDFSFSNNQTKSQTKKQPQDSTRIKWEYLGPFLGGVLIANASIYYIFKDAYWNEERTKFHTFNDWNNADMNIDKLGHIYSGILLTKASYKIFKATNVPEKQSIIFSTLSSIFFQTQIEIHDAYYKKWGWSWWDFGGNVLGAIYPHLQNAVKPLKAINLKWSYHPSPAYKKGWYEHWIKDYEGFTYYLTFDVHSILPKPIDNFWPSWLNVAVAYGVEKVKLGKNIWNSADRPLGDREWYITLDYSLVKLIKPKSNFLREVLDLIDNFHLPAPAVRISPSTIWYGIYF
ncbi:MAG: YfiM family protein [Ignavibacteria bacterium]|nr:YfiM family protein [Ignavibacteria bacterium]